MYEFDSVSVSTYEAASLAAKLGEKSAAGWEVVAIVPAGSDITAYVKRRTSSDEAPAADVEIASSAAAEPAPAADPAATAVMEPSGWGTAPASSPAAEVLVRSDHHDGQRVGLGRRDIRRLGFGRHDLDPHGDAAGPADDADGAGWLVPRPAGRYELRYWDGSAWTEHVSRNGQQYTDPPVA